MRLSFVQNENFSKNWHNTQSKKTDELSDTHKTKIVESQYFLRSKHNYTDKDLLQFDTEQMKLKSFSPKALVIDLKKAWTNKEIPLVTKGFFGDTLTAQNISTKQIKHDSFVLVGDKKSGHFTDRQAIDYFMQFIGYPKYRKYIIDTLRTLDNLGELK